MGYVTCPVCRAIRPGVPTGEPGCCGRPLRRLDPRTRRAWAAIEAEYGEPVRDVIVGFRTQGCSWRTVAGALGCGLMTLVEWRHRLGLPVDGDMQFDALSREEMSR